MNKVEPLKKITLSFQAGTTSTNMDLAPEHSEYSFIFALAPEGMTPFEYELVEKVEGEDVLLHLKKRTLNKFFEHLNPPIWDLLKDREEIHLKVTIKDIAAAENREVVRAMAEMAAHGGCGCGCG